MVKRNRIATMSRIFAIVAVVVILGAALGAGTALAAKGGVKGKPGGNGGGGNGGNGGAVATLTVSPNPVSAFGGYVVSGSGFSANELVSVGIRHTDATYWSTVTTDGNGAFSFTRTAKGPGYVVHEAYQQKNKRSWEMKASVTLTVMP